MDILTPSLSYSIAEFTRGGRPEAFGVDAAGRVWFVTATTPASDDSAEEQAEPDADAIVEPTRFRVVQIASGRKLLDIEIECPVDTLSFVDALEDGILVGWARAEPLGAGAYEPNAWVFGRDGTLERSLFVGDGIEELQVAGDGAVWACYFDEGYFGDWDGAASMAAWDQQGRLCFRLPEIEGFSGDEDVTGLNVVSTADAWFICHGALVHLRDRSRAGSWWLAGGGSRAFAVDGHDVLLAGSWGERFDIPKLVASMLAQHTDGSTVARLEAEDQLSALLKLQGQAVAWGDDRDAGSEDFGLTWMRLHPGGNTTVEGDMVLRTAQGESIVPAMVIGRGSRLYVLAEDNVHEVALADLLGR